MQPSIWHGCLLPAGGGGQGGASREFKQAAWEAFLPAPYTRVGAVFPKMNWIDLEAKEIYQHKQSLPQNEKSGRQLCSSVRRGSLYILATIVIIDQKSLIWP